jgi:outer membrane protein
MRPRLHASFSAAPYVWLVAVAVVAAGPRTVPLAAQAPTIDPDVLVRGTPAFPKIWKPYQPQSLPPVDLLNGPQLARRSVDGTLLLSLREFLRLVVENDLDLHSARYDYAIAQVDLLRAQSGQAARGTSVAPLPAGLFSGAIGAGVSSAAGLSAGGTGGAAIATQGKLVAFGPRGIFDPTLQVNLSYDRLENPLNTRVVAGSSILTIPSTVFQTRLQQELAWGTSYSVSFNLQRQASTQTGLLFNPALTSFLSLQVYQPLLNGFGLALNQRFVILADNDRKLVSEAFHTTLTNTLSNAANAYWDIIALRENVRVAEQTVMTAQQQADDVRGRIAVGVMTPLDLTSAESQLASSRVQLVTAQTKLQQQQVLLKTLITRTSSESVDAADIQPAEALPHPDDITIPPLVGSIAKALATRESIQQAELALTNQHIAQNYTHKNLLPTLSAFAAVNAYGLAPGISPALRQFVRWAYPEYSVGITLSFPVFNRSAQADDIRAQIETREAEVTVERTRRQVEDQVRTATVRLTQGRAQVVAAERASATGLTAFNGEQERLRAGISTPLLVTQAQRDLIVAQSAEIQARVNYAKALVAHQVAVGGFLESYGILFEDAIRGSLFTSAKAH